TVCSTKNGLTSAAAAKVRPPPTSPRQPIHWRRVVIPRPRSNAAALHVTVPAAELRRQPCEAITTGRLEACGEFESGTPEVRSAQVHVRQIRIREVGFHQKRSAQITASQGRFLEVHRSEITPLERHPLQVH